MESGRFLRKDFTLFQRTRVMALIRAMAASPASASTAETINNTFIALFFDVDFSAGLLLDTLNHLTTRSDNQRRSGHYRFQYVGMKVRNGTARRVALR